MLTKSFVSKYSVPLMLLVAAMSDSFGAPGSLDPTFGSGGKVITIFDSDSLINSMAIQGDGKIVVGGTANVNGIYCFALTRYNSSGALDPSFGTDGRVTTQIGNYYAGITSIALQSDGSILAAGYYDTADGFANNGNANSDFVAVRYTSNGEVDLPFGVFGSATTSFGNFSDQGQSLTVQPDGNILLGGTAMNGLNVNFALARYTAGTASTPGGKVDDTFGVNNNKSGRVSNDFGNGKNDYLTSIAVQSDGKILAAGYVSNGTDNDFLIVRYDSTGTIDPTFGTNNSGMIIKDFGGNDSISGMAIQKDGKILVSGNSKGSVVDIAMMRYTADGHPDTSFGAYGDGAVFTTFGEDNDVHGMALQSDGSILLAGSIHKGSDYYSTLVRFAENGALDKSFGAGTGRVATKIADSSQAYAVTVQPDGRILTAGYASIASVSNFALARYSVSTEQIIPVPRLSIAGKKKMLSAKAKVTLKGTATDIGGTLSRVEVKVGKKAYKSATGTASWKFSAKLKPGKNVILARAIDKTGIISPVVQVTVTRR